ncbi:maleylpyruvate isomerase family mycothiol-dependent enzyme [Nocardia harenae]|uniref:maleylpyruvate isomerase family mycothiol-dependent enzyme n=1 Tax=Nocardia harenae TaxID=358707 RepID=UPI000836D0B9|nr:maleylpyruvate isomerase family mycothiol-dependent enzyme [Nocardia harenae]
MADPALWAMIHTERRALADDLAELSAEQWAAPSLCSEWTVEEVVAHLTAAADTGPVRWVRSMAGARFDAAKHNARRIAQYRGADPAETLARFLAVVDSTTAASGHTAAWLGEVVVHAQDIRQPLGLPARPGLEACTQVARFFASRNFAVNSKDAVAGLRLEATDGPFAAGAGPLVTGPTLALVMAMAGRGAYRAELTGPAVAALGAPSPQR